MAQDHGTITITRGGKEYRASWRAARGMITVSHALLGEKTAQVGSSGKALEALARIMLGELVADNEPRAR